MPALAHLARAFASRKSQVILLFNSRITNGGEHAFVRAYLWRNPVNGARGIERRAGAFVRVATETDGAPFAIFLVTAEEIQDIAGHRSTPNLFGIIKDIPQNVGRIRLACNKPRAGEKVTVRGTGDNAFGHLAAGRAVALPSKPEL